MNGIPAPLPRTTKMIINAGVPITIEFAARSDARLLPRCSRLARSTHRLANSCKVPPQASTAIMAAPNAANPANAVNSQVIADCCAAWSLRILAAGVSRAGLVAGPRLDRWLGRDVMRAIPDLADPPARNSASSKAFALVMICPFRFYNQMREPVFDGFGCA